MPEATSDKAYQLREYGLKTAAQLRDSARHAKPEHQDELIALAARITYCNSTENTWLGSDLHNQESGELFEGFGRYWHCSSKLCSYCLRLNAKRNRATLREAIDRQKLRCGEHYRFITLTIPNLGFDIVLNRAIINRAWALFRKRSFFVRSVVGGAKAEEFTTTPQGFHYHLHILVRSKTMKADDFRDDWTQCVEIAFEEAGLDFDAVNSDDMLWVKLKIVHKLSQVANEVCKYITKADSWYKMPMDALVTIALIPHWHRMFEVFGSFRDIDPDKPKKGLHNPNDDPGNSGDFDDTGEPNEPRNYWRTLLGTMTLPQYLKRLHAEVQQTIRRRHEILQLKFPWATITALESG